MAKIAPEIGRWYQDAERDLLFEVVAVDEHAGTIEIQYEDGELDEFDEESWQQLILLPAEPPEDWRIPYELDDDDQYDSDAVLVPRPLGDPLAPLDGAGGFDLEDLP